MICPKCHSGSIKFVGLENYSEFLAGRMTLEEWQNSPIQDVISCMCEEKNEHLDTKKEDERS